MIVAALSLIQRRGLARGPLLRIIIRIPVAVPVEEILISA